MKIGLRLTFLRRLLASERLLAYITKLHLCRVLSRLLRLLLLTLADITTALTWEESASKAIRWMSLFEHTSTTVRRNWVRIYSKRVCLSLRVHLLGLLMMLTSLYTPFSWILVILGTSNMKLLGVVTLAGVRSARHMRACRDTILSDCWRSTPSTRLCLVLGEVDRGTPTFLERAHVRLTESRWVVVTCRALSHIWLWICACFFWVFHSRIIVVENDIVIVLPNMASQIEMLAEEAYQFFTGPVVGNQCWLRVHLC